MNIVITMAGEGSRFKRAGFNVPKFKIESRGKTLFEWSILSLKNFFNERFVFIARRGHSARQFIIDNCQKLGISNFEIVEIDQLTDGQASTVMCASALIDSYQPILIYNIDTFVKYTELRPKDIKGSGWVPVFEADGDKWSFAEFDSEMRITNIAEKERISAFATIGLYYFESFKLYRMCYEQSGYEGSTERYIAPMYSVLLGMKGAVVYAHIVPSVSVRALGTPEDVRSFEACAGI